MNTEARFPALHARDFRLLWTGQVISFSGTWMHATAQGWLVYSLTKSPLYLGLVAAAGSLPIMLFVLLGGVVADRFRKRSLLILTQALSIVPAVGVGVLTQTGAIQVWHVVLFVLFLGTVNAFDVPARQAFFAEIVERNTLMSAIALNSVAFNGARIIGPVIAGLTITYFGLPACFYINALSFFAVIIALVRMQHKGIAARPEKNGVMQDLMAGMRFIKTEPVIRPLLTLTAIFSLFAIPFISLLPIFAADILHSGARGLGYLAGSAGAGAFVAAISLAYRGKVAKQISFMRFTAALFPAAVILFSFSTSFYLSAFALAVAGWGLVSFLALTNSTIQLRTSDGLRGRVMSAYTLVFLGLAPAGNSLLGFFAEIAGTPQALGTASALCMALAIVIGMRLRGAEL